MFAQRYQFFQALLFLLAEIWPANDDDIDVLWYRPMHIASLPPKFISGEWRSNPTIRWLFEVVNW